MSILEQFKEALTKEIDLFILSEESIRAEDERVIAELKAILSAATTAAGLRRKMYFYVTQQMEHKLFYMFRNDLKNRMNKLLRMPQYSLEALIIDESQEINKMNMLLLGQIHSLQAMIENSHPEMQRQILILQEENAALKEKLKIADQNKQILEQTIESFGQKTQGLEIQVETLTHERDSALDRADTQSTENQRLRAKAIEDESKIKNLESQLSTLQKRPQGSDNKSVSLFSRLVM